MDKRCCREESRSANLDVVVVAARPPRGVALERRGVRARSRVGRAFASPVLESSRVDAPCGATVAMASTSPRVAGIGGCCAALARPFRALGSRRVLSTVLSTNHRAEHNEDLPTEHLVCNFCFFLCDVFRCIRIFSSASPLCASLPRRGTDDGVMIVAATDDGGGPSGFSVVRDSIARDREALFGATRAVRPRPRSTSVASLSLSVNNVRSIRSNVSSSPRVV